MWSQGLKECKGKKPERREEETTSRTSYTGCEEVEVSREVHKLQGHKGMESGWSRKSDEMKDTIRELPSLLGMLRFLDFTPVAFQAVE